MVKKVIIIISVFLVGVLGYLFYRDKELDKDKLVVERALKVSSTYIDLYKGVNNINDLKGVASSKVIKKINKKYKDLTSLNKKYLDVDRYFYEYGELNVKEPNTYEVLQKTGEKDDSRIFYKNGKPYINLDDLDPYGYGLDGFFYRGVYLKVDTDKYKLYSYEKIKRSLDFRFLFVDYRYSKENGYVDVIYESINKENILKIRCYVNKGDAKIRGVEIYE